VDCHGHCVSPNVHCEGVTCEEGLVNCHGQCVGPNVHCEDDDSEIEEPDAEESSMIWYLIVIVGGVGAALVLGTAGFIWCKKRSPESRALKKDDASKNVWFDVKFSFDEHEPPVAKINQKNRPRNHPTLLESKMSREERAPNESKPVVAVTSEVSPQVALKPALNVDVESPALPGGVSAQLDDDLDLERIESVVNMNNVLRTNDSKAKSHSSYMNGPTKD